MMCESVHIIFPLKGSNVTWITKFLAGFIPKMYFQTRTAFIVFQGMPREVLLTDCDQRRRLRHSQDVPRYCPLVDRWLSPNEIFNSYDEALKAAQVDLDRQFARLNDLRTRLSKVAQDTTRCSTHVNDISLIKEDSHGKM